MNTMAVSIDGRVIGVPADATVLEAARQAGVTIPTLCHSAELKPYGACRLCMVEVERDGRRKLVASCVYPVEPGLIVQTNTERVKRIRRLIVELTWPALESLGREYGITASRFRPARTDCSLCGLCVRYCTEVKKRQTAFFHGRGIDRAVALLPGAAADCADCKACFGNCASGWIVHQSGGG